MNTTYLKKLKKIKNQEKEKVIKIKKNTKIKSYLKLTIAGHKPG